MKERTAEPKNEEQINGKKSIATPDLWQLCITSGISVCFPLPNLFTHSSAAGLSTP
jgi:hypothetical protein